jgi:hypothetical protein
MYNCIMPGGGLEPPTLGVSIAVAVFRCRLSNGTPGSHKNLSIVRQLGLGTILPHLPCC